MFFKNREFRVKMVKTPTDEEIPYTQSIGEMICPDYIQHVEAAIKRVVKHLAIAGAGTIIAYKVMDTCAQIAIKKYGK